MAAPSRRKAPAGEAFPAGASALSLGGLSPDDISEILRKAGAGKALANKVKRSLEPRKRVASPKKPDPLLVDIKNEAEVASYLIAVDAWRETHAYTKHPSGTMGWAREVLYEPKITEHLRPDLRSQMLRSARRILGVDDAYSKGSLSRIRKSCVSPITLIGEKGEVDQTAKYYINTFDLFETYEFNDYVWIYRAEEIAEREIVARGIKVLASKVKELRAHE